MNNKCTLMKYACIYLCIYCNNFIKQRVPSTIWRTAFFDNFQSEIFKNHLPNSVFTASISTLVLYILLYEKLDKNTDQMLKMKCVSSHILWQNYVTNSLIIYGSFLELNSCISILIMLYNQMDFIALFNNRFLEIHVFTPIYLLSLCLFILMST